MLFCCTNTGLKSLETMEEQEVLALWVFLLACWMLWQLFMQHTHSISQLSGRPWKRNSLQVLLALKKKVLHGVLLCPVNNVDFLRRIYFSVMYPLLICLNNCTILQSVFTMKWAQNWSLEVVVFIPAASTVQSDGPGHVDSAFDSATSYLEDGVINSTCFKGSAWWWRGTCEQYVSHCN